MSLTDSPTLHLELDAARLQRRAALGLMLIAAAAPWVVQGVSWAWTAYASFTLTLVVFAGLRLAGWIGPRRLRAVCWTSDGQWRLVCVNGAQLDAELHAAARVFSSAVWLRWRVHGDAARTRSLLLAAGDCTELRRLRVRLRLEGGRPPTADVAS